MVIIYRNEESELKKFFGSDNDFVVPYLNTTIGEVSVASWENIADSKFYIPELWKNEFLSSKENVEFYTTSDFPIPEDQVVVFTDVFEIPNSLDLSGIENSKGEVLIEDRRIWAAYGVKSLQEMLTRSQAAQTEFIGYERVSISSFLGSQVDVLPGGRVERTPNDSLLTSGVACVLTENVIKSTVFGPCFISEDSVVQDSVIYPGSVIVGSEVTGSTVTGSFIGQSKVINSRITECLSWKACLENLSSKSSLFPSGTHILGEL